MPSEKSRYFRKERQSTVHVELEEALTVLENRGPRSIAELLWQRSEYDRSLRSQLEVIVLTARLSPTPDEKESRSFLEGLLELCEFKAEWRERDDGWAQFLAEVVSGIEVLLERTQLDLVRVQIRKITQVAEESSFQMDDCYSCGLEIERLEQLLLEKP
jgi:hypothetical protein